MLSDFFFVEQKILVISHLWIHVEGKHLGTRDKQS